MTRLVDGCRHASCLFAPRPFRAEPLSVGERPYATPPAQIVLLVLTMVATLEDLLRNQLPGCLLWYIFCTHAVEEGLAERTNAVDGVQRHDGPNDPGAAGPAARSAEPAVRGHPEGLGG